MSRGLGTPQEWCSGSRGRGQRCATLVWDCSTPGRLEAEGGILRVLHEGVDNLIFPLFGVYGSQKMGTKIFSSLFLFGGAGVPGLPQDPPLEPVSCQED